MGIPMVAGRDFSALDTATRQGRHRQPGICPQDTGYEDAVGKTFKIDVYKGDPQYEYQVIGVVRTTKYYELREDLDPIAYYSQAQRQQTGARHRFRGSVPSCPSPHLCLGFNSRRRRERRRFGRLPTFRAND